MVPSPLPFRNCHTAQPSFRARSRAPCRASCRGCPGATFEQVVDAAKKACCHEFIAALPEGYDIIVGGGGAHLSGGERQRIAIARAILKDAPIIVLDEATAYIDPENEDRLQKAIEVLLCTVSVIRTVSPGGAAPPA